MFSYGTAGCAATAELGARGQKIADNFIDLFEMGVRP
jgi:hypothetical protein